MKDLLADNVSLKVRRLFSQIDLTNNFKLLTNFVQDFLEKGCVLVYGCISAKQLRKCLSCTHVQSTMFGVYTLCFLIHVEVSVSAHFSASVMLFSSLGLFLSIFQIGCVLFTFHSSVLFLLIFK